MTIDAVNWLYERGQISMDQGKHEQARGYFEQILSMTRESDWIERALESLVRVYINQEDYFWAMDYVRQLRDRVPRDPDYKFLQAKVHAERGEWRQAARQALLAVEQDLDNAEYYRLLGIAVYRCEGYREARHFLEWARSRDPENLDLLFDRVRIEIREGNFQRALGLLQDALEVNDEQQRIRQKMRAIQQHWTISGG